MLDEDRAFEMDIDEFRTVYACPTADGATVTLLVEDPVSAAVVELTQAELRELISGLSTLLREGGENG